MRVVWLQVTSQISCPWIDEPLLLKQTDFFVSRPESVFSSPFDRGAISWIELIEIVYNRRHLLFVSFLFSLLVGAVEVTLWTMPLLKDISSWVVMSGWVSTSSQGRRLNKVQCFFCVLVNRLWFLKCVPIDALLLVRFLRVVGVWRTYNFGWAKSHVSWVYVRSGGMWIHNQLGKVVLQFIFYFNFAFSRWLPWRARAWQRLMPIRKLILRLQSLIFKLISPSHQLGLSFETFVILVIKTERKQFILPFSFLLSPGTHITVFPRL